MSVYNQSILDAIFIPRQILPALLFRALATIPFTPLNLFAESELGAWYDPSDLSSMFQDSAGATPAVVDLPVGRINDKSGRGNHLIQATTSAKPVLRQSGALFYLEFDGVDDGLACASVALATVSQAGFAAAFMPSGASLGIVAETSNSYSGNDGSFVLYCDSGAIVGGIAAGGQDTVQTASTLGIGVTSVISYDAMDITQALAANKLPMRHNKAAIAATTISETAVSAPFFSTFPLNVGARAGGASLRFSGRIYGMILRGTALGADLSNVETYLSTKAGV